MTLDALRRTRERILAIWRQFAAGPVAGLNLKKEWFDPHPTDDQKLAFYKRFHRMLHESAEAIKQDFKTKTKGRGERLSITEAEFGRKIVFLNGVGLFEDAKLLYHHQRYARSLALAKLSQEEFGKVFLLDQAALYAHQKSGRAEWKGFWASWNDHTAKSNLAKAPFGAPEALFWWSKLEDLAKMRALYVEYKDGIFTVPDFDVTKAMAMRMLVICGHLQKHIREKLKERPLAEKDGSPGKGLLAFIDALRDNSAIKERFVEQVLHREVQGEK